MAEYNLRDAAQFLGVKPISLVRYVHAGKIEATKVGKEYVFEEGDLKKYRQEHRQRKGSGRRPITLEKWARNFDRRHGEDAYQRLLGVFENPCKTYEDIAHESGVTPQAVKPWHDRIYPQAQPHERQKVCAIKNRRQELFRNETFRAFYRAARRHFPREAIEPIQSSDKFRTNAVKIKGKKALIRKAIKRPYAQSTQGGKTYQSGHGRTYSLRSHFEDSDYVFYRLRDSDFLFMLSGVLPRRTTLIDSERSKYHKFKNNFDAFRDDN